MFLDVPAALLTSGLTTFLTRTRRDLEEANEVIRKVAQHNSKPLSGKIKDYPERGTFKHIRAGLIGSIKHTPKEAQERRERLKNTMKEAGYPKEYWY